MSCPYANCYITEPHQHVDGTGQSTVDPGNVIDSGQRVITPPRPECEKEGCYTIPHIHMASIDAEPQRERDENHICERCGEVIPPEHPCNCQGCWNEQVGRYVDLRARLEARLAFCEGSVEHGGIIRAADEARWLRALLVSIRSNAALRFRLYIMAGAKWPRTDPLCQDCRDAEDKIDHDTMP